MNTKQLLFIISAFLFMTNCQGNKSQSAEQPKASDMESGNYENDPFVNTKDCSLLEPDTSVFGIRINDSKSTLQVIGKDLQTEGLSPQSFYSEDAKQTLFLTVHPGSEKNEVDIFSVSYTKAHSDDVPILKTPVFATEKGICLGINMHELIEKLGNGYTVKDSSATTKQLIYRIETPEDSKSGLLKRYNMPIYYADYQFEEGKLIRFEFGFEYP